MNNAMASWNWHCPKCGNSQLGHAQLVGMGKCWDATQDIMAMRIEIAKGQQNAADAYAAHVQKLIQAHQWTEGSEAHPANY